MAFIIAAMAPLEAIAQPVPPPPSKASKPTITDGVPIYYYNGDSKVDLLLATDELDVVTEASDLPVEAELKSVSDKISALESANAAGNSRVKLTGIKSRSELAQEAQKLKKNPKVKDVRAVAYRRGAGSKDEHSRQTIGSQISLKLAPGQDIDTINARYGLRIVQKVEFSPNTYIVEVVNGGLLSALDAANNLKEREKVDFATPLVERQMMRKALPNDTLINQQWHLKNTGGNA